MDTEFLRSRFEARWRNIRKKSRQKSLALPNKEYLWNKLLESYNRGFKCEYCGQELFIKDTLYPYCRSFSFDHKTSIDRGGDNSLNNFAIICHRCNIVKGTMTAETFKEFLRPLLKNSGLMDKVFHEIWSGRLANKLEREETREVQIWNEEDQKLYKTYQEEWGVGGCKRKEYEEWLNSSSMRKRREEYE